MTILRLPPYAENDATILGEYFKNALGVDKVYIYKSKDVTGYFFDNIYLIPTTGSCRKGLKKE